jgi:hypothetical protein
VSIPLGATSDPKSAREWIELFCDVEAALGQDCASKRVQALAARWMELAENISRGDPGIHAGWKNAWLDRQHWPVQIQEQMASYDMEKIILFILEALKVSASLTFKRYYSAKAWQRRMELRQNLKRKQGR